LRTAKQATVRVAAMKTVASHAWPSSVDVMNMPKMLPKVASKVTGWLYAPIKLKKPVAPAATVQMAAAVDATSRALANADELGGSVRQARSRAPMVPALARLTTIFATGNP
jgi:hypothetical protein